MNAFVYDNVIKDPLAYKKKILSGVFQNAFDGVNLFKNVQPLTPRDEFVDFLMNEFSILDLVVSWNFARKSPYMQDEPNFVHSDEMMGNLTAILYLNESPPEGDGTTLYDEDGKIMIVSQSKFNRAFVFNSDCLHSRNIYHNFGQGDDARLIQVVFLKLRDEKL